MMVYVIKARNTETYLPSEENNPVIIYIFFASV